MWIQKKYPDTIYFDLRPEVKPDVIGDIRHAPFADETFDLIIFDPPFRSSGVNTKWKDIYGIFDTADILNLIIEGLPEMKRILKKDGILNMKWSPHSISLKRVLALIPAGLTVLLGQQTAFRTKHASSTYWFTIIKE